MLFVVMPPYFSCHFAHDPLHRSILKYTQPYRIGWCVVQKGHARLSFKAGRSLLQQKTLKSHPTTNRQTQGLTLWQPLYPYALIFINENQGVRKNNVFLRLQGR